MLQYEDAIDFRPLDDRLNIKYVLHMSYTLYKVKQKYWHDTGYNIESHHRINLELVMSSIGKDNFGCT